MTRGARRTLAGLLLLAVTVVLGGCADDTTRAADLGWYRPDPGQRWCDVLTDAQVERLAPPGASGPWQSPPVPGDAGSWDCTVAPDLDGRDGTGETSPSLVSLTSRLYPPRTPAVVAAGNYSPVDEGLEGELIPRGGGLHTAEHLGLYVLRRPCGPARGGEVPDDLEVRMFLTPDRLPAGESVDVLRRAWDLAAPTHHCPPTD
ncbi:hypothetical protein [uncultured Nocardioides sp.]|uniref:hypothetical protein n=1 Tax=uncultured Nocardioides sp. TaxID=198441 RepID=UPI00262FF208|nr:hypothetical protein [uncultured Nocardioides sp.]